MQLHKDQKVEAIKRVPLFKKLSKKGLQEVASVADEIDFPEGKALTKEGERGREFFILLDGEAEVRRQSERIAVLGKGDFLGEIALVTKLPRTATVTTTSPVRALVITDRDFSLLLKRSPMVGQGVLEALGERLAPHLS
jgi:CRP/FNR family transcriptional regulator, cyclic AMP receptor protein